ncbi:MAG: hypothetical protein QG625_814 [Cyanobacteriota bacterium erpe_2018_sw_39hr_WHONDRS-SW48-000098_B_bin.30]|jgi:regulator of protease activity HflC (stomatin/prohibitin superfamily)|nr:SPFH domain-containing protein [Candidatus Obscuribacter sp.]MDQ5964660.1 hypothetical protein [Cyanobacteriota bacterium erpe_2018_sw_39hr_WHONDRS-SW48-000098_B_bin.30]
MDMTFEIFLLLLPLTVYFLAGIKVVYSYQRMVVYRFGKPTNSHGPGLTFIWPVIEKELRFDVSQRSTRLPKVLIGNETTTAVSGDFTYRIDDVIKAVGKNRVSDTANAFTRTSVTKHTAEIVKSSANDIDKRTQEAVRKVLTRTLPGLTVLECTTQRGQVEKQILAQVNLATSSFGVIVTSLNIDDFKLITSLLVVLASLTPQVVSQLDSAIVPGAARETDKY